jgi:cellulose synthase/poly-beta-1,6-N-acetylglucosamine synthase-like glycosyltransferase
MDYTYELVGTFTWRVLVACLFPLGAWLFSLLDHFSLFLSCMGSTSIMLSLYISFLILQHLFLISNSQTWHEYKKNIHIYNIGKDFQRNLGVVFGRRWYLVLFSPMVSSQPVGDGMTFDMSLIETHRIGAKHN